MIILILAVFGACLGSFVNALVWRLHEQEKLGLRVQGSGKKRKTKSLTAKELSITKGRSMCSHCHHALAAKDLVPVLSWIELRGKCRYCHAKIEDTPLAELATSGLFVASYIWWPMDFGSTMSKVNFIAWLIVIVGLVALFMYDLKWMILPNRVIFPLVGLAAIVAVLNITVFGGGVEVLRDTAISLGIASGLFYALYQLSNGKWIGGGDVKLGMLIGLLIPAPLQAFIVLFLASLIGTAVIAPGLYSKKLNTKSHIPFGPFLIIATIIVKLFGATLVTWYRKKFLLY